MTIRIALTSIAREMLNPRFVFAGLLLAACPAWGALDEKEEDALAILLDPHAGSNQKLDAISVLAQAGRDEHDRVTFALTRQCHFDMQPVRDLAKKALGYYVGDRDADRLIASHFPRTGDFLADFTEATKGLKDAESVSQLLVSNRAATARDAMRTLAGCAVASPRHLPSITEGQKMRLVGHLERIDFVDPSVRREVLTLVDQLDPLREAALPLMLRAADDSDSEIQQFVRRLPLSDSTMPRHEIFVATIVHAVSNSDRRIAAAAAGLISKIPRASIQKQTTQLVASITTAAACGNINQIALLGQCNIPRTEFIEAVFNRYSFAAGNNERPFLLIAIRLASVEGEVEDSPRFLEVWNHLITDNDEAALAAATELYNSPKLRTYAIGRMVASIKAGRPISPQVIKAFNPDPESFSRQLLESLRGVDSATCRVAIKALLVTGIKGDAASDALNLLLRNPDNEIRHGAANLLNTPQAIARARVPDLLSDLRSNELITRQRAARQLDELNIEPKEITSALIRAVEAGNFAAREGLLAALDTANSTGKNPLDLLNQVAKADDANDTPRAYARAALREVKP